MAEQLNELIDRMYLLREQKRGLEKQVKEVDAELAQVKQAYIARCKEVGTQYARGSLASATVTELEVPQIEDWGQVSEWIMENDALYLVHRRISAGPWKELRDAGTDVPGIEPYTKVDVSLRRLGD